MGIHDIAAAITEAFSQHPETSVVGPHRYNNGYYLCARVNSMPQKLRSDLYFCDGFVLVREIDLVAATTTMEYKCDYADPDFVTKVMGSLLRQ